MIITLNNDLQPLYSERVTYKLANINPPKKCLNNRVVSGNISASKNQWYIIYNSMHHRWHNDSKLFLLILYRCYFQTHLKLWIVQASLMLNLHDKFNEMLEQKIMCLFPVESNKPKCRVNLFYFLVLLFINIFQRNALCHTKWRCCKSSVMI